LLLFLEYDFIIVYKLNNTYWIMDVLSRLLHETKTTRLLDQTTDAILFSMHIDWLHEVK